ETITIAGTNDGPQVTAALSSNVDEGNASYSLNLLAGASDPDHGETASLSISNVSYSVDGGPSSGTVPAGLSLTGASLAVDPADLAFNSLAVGEQTTITVSYDVVDVHGASVSQSETITIAGTNDGPVNVLPAAQSVNEDTSLVFSSGNGNRISIGDADNGSHTVTLTATHGSLSLNGTTGLSFSQGDGSGDASMTFSGSDGAINAALNGMSFLGNTNYNGAATLTLQTGDSLASDSDTVNLTVNGVNDGPLLAVPAAQTVNQNAALSLGGIGVSDVDDADNGVSGDLLVQVSLSVGHGSLALASATGLSGDLSGSDGTLQITGTLNNVNAALTGLSYQGSLNYSGSDALAISASDLGHDGSGGALTSSGSVSINVVATNHAPTDISLAAAEPSGGNNLPGAGTVLGTFSSTDPDAGDSFSYSLLAGSSAGFTVGAISGTLTATSALSQSSTYTLNVQTTDSHGASYSETLNIITGSNQQGQITGNDTLPGSGAGSPILVGDDVLYGSGGNDLIFGGSGNDSLFGQGGDDMLQGGAGNDLLSGANGADIFRWVSGDNGAAGSPAVDRISNFSTATGGGNNDKLDLTDLLQGEHANAGSLDAFLDFHVSGGNTTIDVRASSGGSITQQIVLQGVDLSNGGTLTSDAQIITSLLGDQKLVVDA
ncbi:MAG TPA: type I secretion C-terminal target domain-containing protein, partial [Azospira sp.]|nr:type I secretion C-terminal target domain-containing protein [Azospira sp.]